MSNLITELTPEQEQLLPSFREEWLKTGLNTETINQEQAKKAVENLYEVNELSTPKVVFAESPFKCLLYITVYKNFLSEEEIKSENLKSILDNYLKEEEDPNSGYSKKLLKLLKQDYVGLWFIGGWDNYWLCFYKFAELIGVKLEEKDKLNAYVEYAKECGCMYAFDEIAFVSDRPERLTFDEQKRLHGENKAALEFRDGYSLYSWHGTLVPQEWILNPESLTSEIALNWENVEQRRCACEIIGWDKVLQSPSLNPKIIDEDTPEIGTLIEVDLPEAPSQWFLKYRCGTGRWFAESVNDKSFDTALKANAGGNGWRGQGDPMSFIPFVRT